MADAISAWSVEHDAAVISWDHKPNDFPLEPINKILEQLYRDPDATPYLYEAYRDQASVGLLIAGNFNPSNDEEICAAFDKILFSHQSAPVDTGEWASRRWVV